jgi:long-subunit acyl-CoA synthetase (AMP-forming)
MDFERLVAELPNKKAAIYTLERGKTVRRPHAALAEDVARIRARLLEWGVKPRSRVGIYAPNSYDWLVHDLALIAVGAISVPFTDDFTGKMNEELLDRYDIALLLISANHARLFAQRPAHVALMDGENAPVFARERTVAGEADLDDQFSLVFSSGSAGGLKGLVISRKGVADTLPPIVEAIGIREGDRILVFLPMSNFQQRNMCYAALWLGIDIIITDYTQMFNAMRLLQPTVLIAPPVLYQMVYAEFEKRPARQRALWLTLGRLLSFVPGAELRLALARRLLKPLHDQFGGRMRLLVTGMAPIRHNIGAFFRDMQLPLCESYGMVESGSLTFRPAHSRKYGSVGRLLRGVELSFEPDGEIIVHRENPLALRYFQCASGENERTFVGKKRVATGDIGHLDADGDLFLKGRKKELIVTPGGYKVHPEIIEQEINNCPDVAHSVIFLKAGASQLTCVIDLGAPADDDARARVKKHVEGLSSIRRAAQFVEVIFADESFNRDNGLLRPNLKIDRRAIEARYGA